MLDGEQQRGEYEDGENKRNQQPVGQEETKRRAAGRTKSKDVGSAAGLAGFPREA